MTLPYSQCFCLDGAYVNPVLGQQFVGNFKAEIVVLHEQLLDVSEAVCQRRLRIQVQKEEASARRDHLARVYHWCPSMPWSRELPVFHPDLLLVLLDEGDVASVLELEELCVLVGVKDIFLGPIDLLLEHPVAEIGDGLLQDRVLLGVVADRRPSELFHEPSVAHFLNDAMVLTVFIAWRCFSCSRK